MYVDDSDMVPELRQGDVVSLVHIVGAINLNAIQFISTAGTSGIGDATAWQVPDRPKFGDAMVLSHSCEIDLENTVKLTSIILAPLRDVHTATKPERIEELIRSNYIDREAAPASYLKYFYLDPNHRFENTKGCVVDFSKCYSVRKQSYEVLKKNKVAELKDDARESMAIKLALYFYRSQQMA
ncbi:MAG: hypothetical protein H6978_08335 [Gammaproteobacteria bacterium]|nr:hypothetical protein [Gammaproteobacteria bacterium]